MCISLCTFVKVRFAFHQAYALSIEQFKVNNGITFYGHCHHSVAILIVVNEVGSDANVFNMHIFVARIEITLARNTTQPPEILILTIGAITPSKGLESNEILAWFEIFSEVKFSSHLAIFSVTNKRTIHPQIHIRGDRAEMGYHLTSIPISW